MFALCRIGTIQKDKKYPVDSLTEFLPGFVFRILFYRDTENAKKRRIKNSKWVKKLPEI